MVFAFIGWSAKAQCVATFSYTGTPYCGSGINPSPTYSGGGVAGTFTSTSGLSINSSTGNVNLSLSTPGTYSVTNSVSTSGGCFATSSITINAAPTIANAGANQNVCGSTATMAANTAIAGTGLWTLMSGAGTVTTPSSATSAVTGLGGGANVFEWDISNAPCTATSSQVTITRNSLPTIAAAGPNQTVCSTATLAGNTPIIGTGIWTLISGTGTITQPLSQTSTLTGLGFGPNVFQWTISNPPCGSTSSQVTVTSNCMGISVSDLNNSITISPNPFTSQTTITFNEEQKNTTITIMDVIGKEIKTINFSGKQYILDKEEMSKGIYFVQITSFDKVGRTFSINKKIIVQ